MQQLVTIQLLCRRRFTVAQLRAEGVVVRHLLQGAVLSHHLVVVAQVVLVVIMECH